MGKKEKRAKKRTARKKKQAKRPATTGIFERLYTETVRAGSNFVGLIAGIGDKEGRAAGKYTVSKEQVEKTFNAGFGRVLKKAAGVVSTALLIVATPVKAIIPKSIGAKLVMGTAVSALTVSPTLRKAVHDIPMKALDVGAGIGRAVEEAEESDKAKVLGAATLGVLGGAVGLIVGKDIIEKIQDKDFKTSAILDIPDKQLITEKPVGIQGEVPLTPEITTISTGKKPYKRRRAKKTPSIRQSIKINIINRPQALNKKYIKNIIYV